MYALPKLLLADVRFTVNPGTYDGEIVIDRFCGSGKIAILGAAAVGQTTHNILRMTIKNCSIPRLFINGLTATATSGLCFVLTDSSTIWEFVYCNSHHYKSFREFFIRFSPLKGHSNFHGKVIKKHNV